MQTSPSPDLAAAFKGAMKQLVAGVSLLTTRAVDGSRHGMLVTNLASVGAPAAALLICVNRGASMHDSLLASGRFGVNLLRVTHADLVAIFTGKPSGEARFAHGCWRADADGVPILEDALASFACRVATSIPFDGNTLFIGRVEACHAAAPFDPLTYMQGVFRGPPRLEDPKELP